MSALSDLYEEIAFCQQCTLSKTRTMVVPGEGAENADIVFVGEAPGWHEDKQGRPFVGPAGKFLDDLLDLIGFNRSDVYIANIIKCRPPNNRDPLHPEINACENWLDRQLEIIKPKMIVTLGRYSMARYFPGQVISKIHGTAKKEEGIIYFAMYHPAAALHQQKLRQVIEDDMRKIPNMLADDCAMGEKKEKKEERPEQLSMF
ncbi:MAG: uracil-DNA glycosylase [Desulfatiglandales bacterium]|nr:uracil-DNA glycosylase [Desulfatiglandales bacterium]